MSNDLKVKTDNAVDGFDGFNDGVEGADAALPVGVIRGALVKFSIDFHWVLQRDGVALPPDLELIVIDVARIVQRWINSKPVETIILEPGQPFPNMAKLNAEAPEAEWTEKFGKMTGPWQKQMVTYLLDPKTMDRYTFATNSVGGGIATREIVDRTNWMRKLRGSHVYPVVVLSDKFMPTNFGGRQRPHFEIKRWVALGSDQKVLPEKTAELTKPTEKIGTTVEEPTTEEVFQDEIKY